jgi:hypothetical protein
MSLIYGSLRCDPLSQEGHPTCIPPTHEPVDPLISFVTSPDDLLNDHLEKRSSGVRHLI